MAKPLLSDGLWAVAVIEPVLPEWSPSPEGGRPRPDDRGALTGIPFVLKAGIPREDLPCEMGCGCGMTCWRRLRDWQADGTWGKIHRVLPSRPRGAGEIDRSGALIDGGTVRAAYGGEAAGPSPADRGEPGSKHHLITDASGIPPAGPVTAADVDDVTEMAPPVNELPGVAGKAGRPRRGPDALQGGLACDSEPHRRGSREMGAEPELPEEGIGEGTGPGEARWPAERTLPWAHQNRRLRIRYERRLAIHQASLTLVLIKFCASALFAGLC